MLTTKSLSLFRFGVQKSFLRRLHSNQIYGFASVNKPKVVESKPVANKHIGFLNFDPNGRLLLIEDNETKRNFRILFLAYFCIVGFCTWRTFRKNNTPLPKTKTGAGFTIGLVFLGGLLWYLSNRHIKRAYLMKDMQNIFVENYWIVGFSSRDKQIPLTAFRGDPESTKTVFFRLVNYEMPGKKHPRTLSYRDEFVRNRELWERIIQGSPFQAEDIEREEKMKRMKLKIKNLK